MLELIFFPGATCGQKVRFAMAEKNVGYEARIVDRAYLQTPDYLKLNRNGVVPTLIHDGTVLTESSVIINYIDDAFPGPPLKPNTPLGVARNWWWMKHADECLAKIGVVTYAISMRPKLLEKTPEEITRYLDGIPDVAKRERRRRVIDLGLKSPDFPVALAGLQLMLSDMEAAISDNSGWLVGDDYSLADTAMTPLVLRLDELQLEGLWQNRHPKVARWWDQIRQRQSYIDCVITTPNPEGPQHAAAGSSALPEIEKLLSRPTQGLGD